VNAYVGPRIERYLGTLERRLAPPLRRRALIMQSNGGVMPAAYVAQKAVAVMGSGRRRRERRRRGGGAAGIRDFISSTWAARATTSAWWRAGVPEVKAGLELASRYLIGLPMIACSRLARAAGSIGAPRLRRPQGRSQERGRGPGPVC